PPLQSLPQPFAPDADGRHRADPSDEDSTLCCRRHDDTSSDGFPLRDSRQPLQRARRDPVHEQGTDHARRGYTTNQRPTWAVPDMHDTDAGASLHWLKGPLDLHSRCYPFNVTETDARIITAARALALHRHLGDPPRGPLHRAERTVGRHLHEPAVVARAFAESDGPVVTQQLRPSLHLDGELEDGGETRAHHALVHRAHFPASWKGAEVVRLTSHGGRIGHDGRQATLVFGVQLAVKR